MFKSASLSLILLGVLAVIVGVVAIAWPGVTILALVAIWAFVAGFAEIFAAFASGETAGTRAMFIVTGLISVALGVVLSSRPDVGAVTLALLFGLFSLTYGVSQVVMGVQLRQAGRALRHPLQRERDAV